MAPPGLHMKALWEDGRISMGLADDGTDDMMVILSGDLFTCRQLNPYSGRDQVENHYKSEL